jgi:hypothetical protein
MGEETVREVVDLTPDRIHAATGEMLALVYGRLPERFWPSEKKWRLVMTAQVARMAGIVESMDRLVDPRCQPDAVVLLRTLYENLVNLAWFAIDPDTRVFDLIGHAMVKRKAMHNDLVAYGVDDLMSPDELERAKRYEALAPLDQRAEQVDMYWGPRIRGFYENAPGLPKPLLTLRGLYIAIYRLASRHAHGSLEALDHCARQDGRRIVVERQHPEDSLLWSALALPVFAMGLVVASARLGWPDESAVRAINDALIHDSA